MIKDYDSPFAPGHPAEPQLSVGRVQQVQTLLERICRSFRGQIEVVSVGGEPGIGRTSFWSNDAYAACFQRVFGSANMKVEGDCRRPEQIRVSLLRHSEAPNG